VALELGVDVGVTDRAEPGVVLTQRTETLRNHAGQIAFPGGRADPGDADLVATALREAEEEIGLPPRAVTVIGLADRYRTVTGFEVTPVLGVIPPD
ncbi:NUDIX domain-containing protein, partial [Streptomyces scabiei]|uniref:NUDIX domain-containing protein n=1 Tax=Streptomyces scabiei TaxID=1930 RepID=UPI0038F7EA2C